VSDIDEIRKRHFASATRNAYLPEHQDRATLLALLKTVQTEISDCRDAYAPDHPPHDLNEFMREIEIILK